MNKAASVCLLAGSDRVKLVEESDKLQIYKYNFYVEMVQFGYLRVQ